MSILETLELLFKNLKDPVWVLVFLLVAGLILTCRWLFKSLEAKDLYISSLHECISENIAESNKTLIKAVTLIEGMVYGRGHHD